MSNDATEESVADSLSTAHRIRRRFWIWTALMVVMLAVLGLVVAPKLQIETDILALLPATQDNAVSAAVDKLSSTLAERQLFLIGANQLSRAKQAAQKFADSLTASHQFTTVDAQVGGNLNKVLESYRSHWAYLISDRDRARLQANKGDEFYRDALRAAYTPSGTMRLLPLAQDPLGIVGDFLQQQLPSQGNAHLDGAMLVVENSNRHYVLVTAETKGSAMSGDVQDAAMPAIDAATQAAKKLDDNKVGAKKIDDIEILTSGALQHATAAAQRAQNELQLFGTIESISVLALLLYVFGRLRPLILGMAVLGLSAGASIVASYFIFGKVHVLTLVFGASLVGVVIDYSMHFFADQFREPKDWTPARALAHVGPAIILGMITTLVGYAGLALMPFPGLRQMAVFCIAGIVVGCASVLCLYPLLMGARRKPLPQRAPLLMSAFDNYLQRWRWSKTKMAVVIGLSLVAIAGALQLQTQDDIHSLQASPPELMRNEARVSDILGGGIETRFFLVQAVTEESLLQREEMLRARLDAAVAAHHVGSYMALTRALPSEQQQREDHQLMSQTLYQDGGPWQRVMKQFGFSKTQIDARLAEFRDGSTPLHVEQWLASPAAKSYRPLWLGNIGGQFSSVVTLSGIHSVAHLNRLGNDIPGVRFIDRPQEVSAVMSRYRQVTSGLLLLANFTALLILCWRFGWRDAIRLVLPSIGACVATLGVFGWLGIGFNLFNAFALLLVLALGIDYGIFLLHGREARVTAILSVTLSACTTLIGFGMLAFSATPFIRSIGATLLLGIICSWAFVMLSCMTQRRLA